jgi:hypothetical protein
MVFSSCSTAAVAVLLVSASSLVVAETYLKEQFNDAVRSVDTNNLFMSSTCCDMYAILFMKFYNCLRFAIELLGAITAAINHNNYTFCHDISYQLYQLVSFPFFVRLDISFPTHAHAIGLEQTLEGIDKVEIQG